MRRTAPSAARTAEVVRRTLTEDELRGQVEALRAQGHKRLILVFGEHPRYDPEFIAECVRKVYSVKVGHGEIRRVNINAAPLDHAGYATVKAAGIGTYQIFQETYHHATYARVHPRRHPQGRLSVAAGRRGPGHGGRLRRRGHRGPVRACTTGGSRCWAWWPTPCTCKSTTTSGRTRSASPACGRPAACGSTEPWLVGDHDFKRLVAILRLAVPYTGLICTARETAALRREVMAFGVSQIDAGSRIELGGYTEAGDAQVLEREQFELGDIRPLDAVMRELIADGYIPSFCTACYRLGRTGEHFMEFAIPGFIQNLCTPNALTTLMEYLVDYGSSGDLRRRDAADPAGARPPARRPAQARPRRASAADPRDGRARLVVLGRALQLGGARENPVGSKPLAPRSRLARPGVR